MKKLMGAWIASALLLACGGEDLVKKAPGPNTGGKADGPAAKAFYNNDLAIYVDRRALVTDDDEQTILIFVLRSTRDIENVSGFYKKGDVHDPVGEVYFNGPRDYEFHLPLADAVRALRGERLIHQIDYVPDNTSVDTLYALLDPRIQLDDQYGWSCSLSTHFQSIFLGGEVVYRSQVRCFEKLYSDGLLKVDDKEYVNVKRIDEQNAQFDLSEKDVLEGVASGKQFKMILRGRSLFGVKVGLQWAHLASSTSYIGPSCYGGERNCLDGLPEGTVDISGCVKNAATALDCADEHGYGFYADDQMLWDAADNAALLFAPGSEFYEHAAWLVGEDKQLDLVSAVNQAADDAIFAHADQWFLDEMGMQASFEKVVKEVIDVAYARPFSFVEPHEVFAPATFEEMRDIIADKFMLYIHNHSFVDDEWTKPLVWLIAEQEYRMQHLNAFKSIRQAAYSNSHEEDPYNEDVDLSDGSLALMAQSANNPDKIFFIGGWLGAYIEIAGDKATGQVVVHFEVD